VSKEIEQEVTRFIVEEVLDEDTGLTPDQPLLSGLLDSFGLMSLLSFIEEHYDVTIPNNEVVTENFRTIEVLAAFVERKRQADRASA
jgi:acyl carrier protein